MAYPAIPQEENSPWFNRPQIGLTDFADIGGDAAANLSGSPEDVYTRGVRALVYALQNRPENGAVLKDPTQPPDLVGNLARAFMSAGIYTPSMPVANNSNSQDQDRLTLRGEDADDANARVQQFLDDGLGAPDPMAAKMLELGKTSFADQFVATPYPESAATGTADVSGPQARSDAPTAENDTSPWVGGYDLPGTNASTQDTAPNRSETAVDADPYVAGAGLIPKGFEIPSVTYLGTERGGDAYPEPPTNTYLPRSRSASSQPAAPGPHFLGLAAPVPFAAPTPADTPPLSLTSDILAGLNGFRQNLDEVGEDPGTSSALRVAAAVARSPASFIPNAAAAVTAPVGYVFDPNFRSAVNAGVSRFLSNRPVDAVADAIGNYVGQRASGGFVGAAEVLRDVTELVGAGIPTGMAGKVAGTLAVNAARTGAQATRNFGLRLTRKAQQRPNGVGATRPALRENGRLKDRNGYAFFIDELGRTTHVWGGLSRNPLQARNVHAQRKAGGSYRLQTDEGGHFVGRRFNGPLDEFNHFAQDTNLNRGTFKALEDAWQRALDSGQSVYIDIRPKYKARSLRPSTLEVNFVIGGTRFREIYKNRAGGK